MMAPQAPLPEAADEGYGLFQHGAPCRSWRPGVAEEVLVEVLPRPHAKHKAPWQQRGRSCSRLRDDGRMHPDEWARHASAHPQPRSRLGDATDDAPHKGALALLSEPGMIVIREHGKGEAGLLRLLGIAYQVAR